MLNDRLMRAAPAKINLFLHITGRRDDGYHNLQTVFQFLDYADELRFELREDERIVLKDVLQGVPSEADLVCQAAYALREYSQIRKGVTIARKKVLPIGGGLGGGSSNAATTLVALNELWQLQLTQAELLQIAVRLGADVPVFVHGKACWAEGVGEKFTDISLPEPWLLVLNPPVAVSTAQVFASGELTRNCSPITIRDFLHGSGRNVFEPVVRAQHPAVGEALDWLDSRSEFVPAMSGTGSSVFVRCKNRKEALKLLAELHTEGPRGTSGFVASACNRSPLYPGG